MHIVTLRATTEKINRVKISTEGLKWPTKKYVFNTKEGSNRGESSSCVPVLTGHWYLFRQRAVLAFK